LNSFKEKIQTIIQQTVFGSCSNTLQNILGAYAWVMVAN